MISVGKYTMYFKLKKNTHSHILTFSTQNDIQIEPGVYLCLQEILDV